MTTPDPSTIALHGWTAVPVDAAAVLQGKPYLNPPTPLLAKDIPFPSSDPLVSRVQKYAKEQLPPQTYNHSMRVFYWGISPPLCPPFQANPPSNNNPHPTIPLPATLPPLPLDPRPRLPPPRHRHRPVLPLHNPTLLRIRRRPRSARSPAPRFPPLPPSKHPFLPPFPTSNPLHPPIYPVPNRSHNRDHHPTPRHRHDRDNHISRAADPASDAVRQHRGEPGPSARRHESGREPGVPARGVERVLCGDGAGGDAAEAVGALDAPGGGGVSSGGGGECVDEGV